MRFQPWKKGPVTWTKWAPVVLLPFGAVFFQTWLNTQTIKRDYRMADLNVRLRELRQTLDSLHVDIARLQNMDRIEMEAPDMGLVPPNPDQIHLIEQKAPPPRELELNPPALTAMPVSPAPPAAGLNKNKEEKCTTETGTPQALLTGAMGRLCKAIAGAYASCFGHS